MLQPNTNTGVIIQLLPTDFMAGGAISLVFENRLPTLDWSKYRGKKESQVGIYFDSQACVTFSALNSIEEQVNWFILTGKMPLWIFNRLNELGFIVDGLFEASDRFTAKMSGTTKQGNSGQKVWDSIINDGLLPEKDWTWDYRQKTPVFDWDTFYAEIPQELKDKAKEVKKLLKIGYEWVVTSRLSVDDLKARVSLHLQQAPLQFYTPICVGWGNTSPVPTCDRTQPQHATVADGIEANGYADFDHYEPYGKILAFDYPVPFVLKGVVSMFEPEKKKIPYLPYYEKVEGQSAICVYDPDTDKFIAYESGRLFKALYGDYSKIRIATVKSFSRDIAEVLTTKPFIK